MSDVIIKFSQIGADGVQRVFEAQNLSIEAQAKLMQQSYNAALKADSGMKQFGTAGVKTMDLLRDGVRDLTSDLAGIRLPSFSGGMGGFLLEGAAMGIDIARQEEQRKRNQQEATRVAGLGAAERRREVVMNLPDDETLNAGNVDSVMQGISKRTGTEFNKVQGAMVPMMSATGALSTDYAAKAAERAFTRMPNNEQFAVDYGARLLDLMNIEKASGRSTDDDKFDQIEGALLSTQAASRVKSQSKMAQTAVPLAKAMSQTGDSTERSFEYFAAMTNLLADEQGDKSRTAMASLSGHIAETQRSIPELKKKGKLGGVSDSDLAAFSAATNTDERLAALHKSPALFKALDEADQFQFGEADTKGVLRGMLSGDGKVMGQLAAAAGKVVWGDQAKGFLGRKMGDLAAGQHQGLLGTEQKSAANIEGSKLGQTLAQRSAAMRKLVTDTVDQTGDGSVVGWFDRKYQDFADYNQWQDSKPEISAERSLMQHRVSASRNLDAATTPAQREKAASDKALIDAQLQIVRLLIEQNELVRQQNNGGGVERPPSAPQSSSLATAP